MGGNFFAVLKEIKIQSVSRVYRYFYPYTIRFRKELVLAFLSGLGTLVMNLLQPWPIKIIFDGILFDNPKVRNYPLFSMFFEKGTGWALAVTCLCIVLIAYLRGWFSYHGEVLTAEVGQRTVASIRRRLYDHLQKLSQSFHDTRQSGDLIVRLTGDISILKEMLVDFLLTSIGGILLVVGMVVIMFWIDWKLTTVALLTVPILMWSITRYTNRIKEATDRARDKEGKVASVAHESLGSISIIQAFTLEKQQYDKFSKLNRSNLRAGLKTTRLVASFQRIIELVLALGACVVMWFGVQRVLEGALSPGDLLVFTAYMKDMYRPLRKLSKLTSRVAKATACGERILDILDRVPAIQDAPDAVVASPFRGEISFDHVSFSYNDREQVLKDVHFTIEPGQRVALVGPSGTGKTTIAYLLLRFYDPQQGSIRIDGREIREFTLGSLRGQISVIMHEPHLFGTTIRENIAMGKPEATDEEIIKAAKITNAHDFIVAMEKGYGTVVGERGATLSRGQKQRIALARAAIHETPLIILDEPTTGLDTESELLVIDALNNMMKGKTCIIIAHRYSTIASSDRILMLEGARIIEDGEHRQLMETSDRYRMLYSLQFSGERVEGGA